jgi:hypothetical protein
MKLDPAEIVFQIECRGSHHGQLDQTIFLFHADTYAGHLDFVTFREQCSIQTIVVSKSLQRRGYATALVQRLQAEFPGQEIDWGYVTDDGALLRNSLATTVLVDQELLSKQARLDKLVTQLDHLQTESDTYWANASRTEHDTQVQDARVAQFEPLRDAIWDLEQELDGKSPAVTLINIPSWMTPADDAVFDPCDDPVISMK